MVRKARSSCHARLTDKRSKVETLKSQNGSLKLIWTWLYRMHASIDERSKWRIFHGSLSVAARFEQLFSNFFRGLSRLLAAFPATLGTEFLLGLVSRVSTISQPILHFSHRVIDHCSIYSGRRKKKKKREKNTEMCIYHGSIGKLSTRGARVNHK